MFVEGSMSVIPAFLESLTSHFMSTAQEVSLTNHLTDKVDFMHAAQEARETIHSWVEANTANKTKDPFPPASLDHMTRMVLAIAIYFKGKSV